LQLTWQERQPMHFVVSINVALATVPSFYAGHVD
jgi:hypothetical protein